MTTRAECPTLRPCDRAACRYHTGNPSASCALDVADRGPHTLHEVAAVMGMSAERIRQIEFSAIRRLRILHGDRALVDLLPTLPADPTYPATDD